MTEWTCPHGVGAPGRPGDCESCNRDIADRPDASTLTGDQRVVELRGLLEQPSAYRFEDVHRRTVRVQVLTARRPVVPTTVGGTSDA